MTITVLQNTHVKLSLFVFDHYGLLYIQLTEFSYTDFTASYK